MTRMIEQNEHDLIDLGAVSVETKGANFPNHEPEGGFGLGLIDE